MTTLIIAEHDNTELKPATHSTVTAAQALGQPIHILVAGADAGDVAQAAAAIPGVDKVLHADSAEYKAPLAENLTQLVIKLADQYDYLMAPAGTFGKNLMPRIAALLDSQQISDISAVEGGDTFKRPIYGGQAIATVKSKDSKRVITVRATAFDAAAKTGGSASVEPIDAAGDAGLSEFVGVELSESERPDLGAAEIVISGGRGLGSGEAFEILEPLADRLGGAIGASRAAVDAGYVPNDYQVGQTGKIVAPNLYIAVGISGAIQHLAGMKDSKVIVAINKDEEAPIFQVADYGLVGDLFKVVPELSEKI